MRATWAVTAGAFLVLSLAGCGGGGGSSAAPSPSATPTQFLPTATATTAATAPPTATATELPPATPTVPPSATPVPTDTPPLATPTVPPPTATRTPEPTATFTPTPPVGPLVASFGLADTNGTFDEPVGTDAAGRPVFGRQAGAGFLIYVEGRPGPSGLPVATNLLSSVLNSPEGRPDLQLLSSRALGDGSPAVCDKAFPNDGGVPAVVPPDFAEVQVVSDALNDLGCRFRVFSEPGFACTQDNNGNFRFASPGTTIQFCSLVNDAFVFPDGDTVLTVRLRDTAGNVGPATELVVRIRGN